MALLNRILVCFPAAVHPALEPPLMDLISGVDEADARAHLVALAAVPGLRLYGWTSESDAPLPERVTLAAPGGLHCYLRREADGRWRLDRARAWGSGV